MYILYSATETQAIYTDQSLGHCLRIGGLHRFNPDPLSYDEHCLLEQSKLISKQIANARINALRNSLDGSNQTLLTRTYSSTS